VTSLNRQFKELLNSLNSAGARYLLLGGYAVNYYGYHRNTKDIDIWIAVSGDNPQRVSRALQNFGFAAASVPPGNFMIKGGMHTFGREPFRVDILSDPAGVDFEACYGRRVEGRIDGVPVPLISLGDLRKNKRASGRPKDIADLDGLPRKRAARKSTRRKRK
jgi:hypothetical protein